MTRDNGIGLNPESYSENGSVFFFADSIRGEFVQGAQNGLTPISDNGLHNYTTDLFGRIQSSGTRVNVFGVYNSRFGQVEFAFEQTDLGGEVLAAETVAYFEEGNFWTSFYSYHPEMMSSNNSNIITFKDGRVWLHNQGLYANYYGVQYDSTVEAVANQGATKAFLAIAMETNQVPEVPQIITPLNQSSFLQANHFIQKEGRWYSQFYRDTLTVGVPIPFINGNVLRGDWLKAKIKIGRETYGRLKSVMFRYKESKFNP